MKCRRCEDTGIVYIENGLGSCGDVMTVKRYCDCVVGIKMHIVDWETKVNKYKREVKYWEEQLKTAQKNLGYIEAELNRISRKKDKS
jgi:uncharacterized protein (UPF0218 family)